MTTPRSFGDAHMASGWIMLLYVEHEREDWHSHWRCVAYAQLPLPSDENRWPRPEHVLGRDALVRG